VSANSETVLSPTAPTPLPLAREYAERALPAAPGSEDGFADSAIRAFHDLHARLRTVIGSVGCEELFRRGLSRAAARHRELEPVKGERTPEALIGALRDRGGAEAAARNADAVREVMAEQISLLAQLIGEDMVQAIIQAERQERPDRRAGGEAAADE